MLFDIRSAATVDVNIFVVVISAAVTTVVEVCDVEIVESLITRTLDTEEDPWLLKRLPHLMLLNYFGLFKN